ncbi:T9SS type A sorting domain-containing protein [Cryomorpha ignava]|uniref:T9SS type A sorting domain-containing protein n=1 Tax=Cryomorpha ignava TaxID=101383 RepID=A0A7K3WLK7_9FLAO|nr:T9SS type A sorting domain-containing protein [Cryomorpha ignava]NEN22536.1 T9SS type A sorting domain-containing protein [Cryomorpha ignava]
MKKILLPLFMGAVAFSANAQISNGDFERWDKVLLFQHPSGASATMSSNYETYFDNGLLNVTKEEVNGNSFVRIENIMGTENVQPGFFIFGKVPSEDMVFSAGNPISDVNMTGISMDLNYDMLDREGFVIVQFKNGNTPVGEGNYGPGTYFFPISGSQDWSNTEFLFDNPIDPSANTCVVALASADLINEDLPFAEGSFMEVDNIAFIGSESTFQGGDFEFWSYVEPLYVPGDCYVDIHPFDQNYQKSLDSYQGSFALRLNSTLRNDNVDVGYALMGEKNEEGGIAPTIALGDMTILSFMYYYLAQDDMGEAKLVFYNESSGSYTPVYEHSIELTSNENYQLIEFPFGNELEEQEIVATHMSIEFKSSIETENITAIDGSVLLLDNVSLGNALGLNPAMTKQSLRQVRSYPNPTMGRVVFNFGTNRAGYYRVYNQLGSQVAIREFSSTKEVVFDLYPYPSGVYTFRFFHNAGTDYARVIRE